MFKKFTRILTRLYNNIIIYPKILKKNKVLKDKFKGDRCFIIGNGSSINKMNLKKLKNEYSFVVNNFFIHSQLEEINPTFFSDIEPFNTLKSLPKNNYYNPSNYYTNMDKHLKGTKTRLFFQIGTKEFIDSKHLFLDHDVYYLQSSNTGIMKSKKLSFDITSSFSFMDGVIYSTIGLATYMGFRDIYLIGCDFDHILTKSELHFYKDKEIPTLEGVSNKELAFNLYTYLSKMEKIKWFLKGREVKIYNAGIGGMTDSFERVDFNKIKFK